MKRQYTNAANLRRAIEERIVQASKKEDGDIQKLRRQVAFDRLLARLFIADPTPWVLKGGYAMQLRTPDARVTKDIDLAIRDGKLLSDDRAKQNMAIHEMLLEKSEVDLKDFFSFNISEPVMDLDAAPYGGARFHIEARIDGRTFEKFHLDIGIGDVWIEPLEQLSPRGWLDFAGIASKAYPSIPKEQQFAEKIHAYTVPRPEGTTNSRTKDLVDMILLISANEMDITKLVLAIRATYERRATHSLSKTIPKPPSTWVTPFERMAVECNIIADLNSAYQTVQNYINELDL